MTRPLSGGTEAGRQDVTSPFPLTGNEGYIRQGLLYGLSGAVLTSTSRRLKVSRDLDTGAISCPISESVDPSSVESAREGLSRGASVPRTRSEWASRVPRAGPAPHPPWPCTVFVSGERRSWQLVGCPVARMWIAWIDLRCFWLQRRWWRASCDMQRECRPPCRLMYAMCCPCGPVRACLVSFSWDGSSSGILPATQGNWCASTVGGPSKPSTLQARWTWPPSGWLRHPCKPRHVWRPVAGALLSKETKGLTMGWRFGGRLMWCALPYPRRDSAMEPVLKRSNGAFPLHGTARFGWVRFTFGGFSTGYSTWYFFSTTLAGVPSDAYRYQNVTSKLYWSLIGRRESSLLRHWTCDTRPNIYPPDLNQHSQRWIGRNFLYQQKNSCFVVCWGISDVPLVDSRGADPARAWWGDAEWKSLMYLLFALN